MREFTELRKEVFRLNVLGLVFKLAVGERFCPAQPVYANNDWPELMETAGRPRINRAESNSNFMIFPRIVQTAIGACRDMGGSLKCAATPAVAGRGRN
ncbi:MAG: hypothetical protein WB680_15080 [Candidatus Acidiferrales bacterium]